MIPDKDRFYLLGVVSIGYKCVVPGFSGVEFLVISIGFCPKCNKLTLIEPGSWKLKINSLVSYRGNMILLENYTSRRMR
jgi:hypothetical protein